MKRAAGQNANRYCGPCETYWHGPDECPMCQGESTELASPYLGSATSHASREIAEAFRDQIRALADTPRPTGDLFGTPL